MSNITWAGRFSWSLRREIWEHPSIWIAPSAAAAVSVVGFLISRLPWLSAAMPVHHLPSEPYDFASGLVMLAAYVVAIFYCLDALYGERRDRSVLFWKSLPVSDTTTVLAKLTIPMVIIPLVTSAVTIMAFFVMALLSNTHPPLLRTSELLIYHLFTVHSLWWAPLFGWLFLISSWARRAPFVWAALPVFVVSVVERIAFNTARFAGILGDRITVSPDAIVAHGKLPTDPMTQLTPGAFLSSWGLWIGLAIMAACMALAIRLRRARSPI